MQQLVKIEDMQRWGAWVSAPHPPVDPVEDLPIGMTMTHQNREYKIVPLEEWYRLVSQAKAQPRFPGIVEWAACGLFGLGCGAIAILMFAPRPQIVDRQIPVDRPVIVDRNCVAFCGDSKQ